MSNERIIIKGTSNGLIITLGAGGWQGLLDELEKRLGETASFFKGGRVALRVGPRQLTRLQVEAVGQVLNQHGVTLWAVESESSGTQEVVAQLGLEVEFPDRSTGKQALPPTPQSDSIVLRRTLRSGQVVHHPGHVVIIGDVNPGAEIRAGGNVVVWGRLRGTVYAGINNDAEEGAVVCALQLVPTQLRIGDCIARAPTDEVGSEIVPEIAFVQGDQIVAEPWQSQ
jgi:septum site-determining protein MinC